MIRPGISQDEPLRLATLMSLGIMDTPPEERFDRLTRMAKRLFGVPIALVSLVDDHRQWFKSCVGLPVQETSADISFCGHAILGNDIFVIPDALLDERFADNPLVLNDPKIRFYAGCPLRAGNGLKLGTLCIIDRKPRQLTADDLEALQDLACMVERELDAIQLATLDELTGISNRRGFRELADKSLKFCLRHGTAASLIFMDLDKFKPINDEFGHAEGDRVLIDFAGLMKTAFRDSDVFARLGGDEFVALLTDASNEVAEEVVGRLREATEKYSEQANRGYALAFSYGIVEFNPAIHLSIDALLADSDRQMYAAKKSRREPHPEAPETPL